MNTRIENGKHLPAVNVKPPLLYQRLPDDLKAVSEKVRNAVYARIESEWWEMTAQAIADDTLTRTFCPLPLVSKPNVCAAGRSNGWIVVENIGDPEKWNGKQRKAWEKFEKTIKASILDAEKQWHEGIREALTDGEVCASGGEHMPDWKTTSICQEDPSIVDVNCLNCGRSGSIGLAGDDVNW